MRHFRDRLRLAGYDVAHERAATFGDGLDAYLADHPGDHLVTMRPPSYGAADRLRALVADRGGTLSVVENELFLVAPAAYDGWAADRDAPTQTDFYRWVRRRTGYLMDGDDPVGGRWTYDVENREPPPEGLETPAPPRFEPDDLTREVAQWVGEEFVGDGEAGADAAGHPRAGDDGASGWTTGSCETRARGRAIRDGRVKQQPVPGV